MFPTEFQKKSLLVSLRARLCARYLKACDRASVAMDNDDEVKSYDTVEELMTALNSDEPLELDKADFWRKAWLLRLMREEFDSGLIGNEELEKFKTPAIFWDDED